MSRVIEAISQRRLLFFPLDRKKEIRAEFERVALAQLSYLYTSSFYLTKDRADAEDLVQETYLRAFRFFDKFQPGTNFRAWLLTILQNLFINRYRQKRREALTPEWEKMDDVYESMVEQDENMGGGNPEHHFVSQMMDNEVEKALRGLPEESRTAIVLVDIEELTYEEAANVMECPMGAVRSRVSQGRRMLQVALKEYGQRWGRVRE